VRGIAFPKLHPMCPGRANRKCELRHSCLEQQVHSSRASATAARPLDVSGPTSFDIAKLLPGRVPTIKIIAFAVKETEQDVVACAVAGFAGYVPHDGSEADLMAAIDHAMCGELHCSPRVAGLLFRHLTVVSAPHPSLVDPTTLTQRERQVLALLAQGMSNKEIAREAQISSATVKNHVHNILKKPPR